MPAPPGVRVLPRSVGGRSRPRSRLFASIVSTAHAPGEPSRVPVGAELRPVPHHSRFGHWLPVSPPRVRKAMAIVAVRNGAVEHPLASRETQVRAACPGNRERRLPDPGPGNAGELPRQACRRRSRGVAKSRSLPPDVAGFRPPAHRRALHATWQVYVHDGTLRKACLRVRIGPVGGILHMECRALNREQTAWNSL